MTNTTATANLTQSADDANHAAPGGYRRAKGPILTAPAAPRLRSGHHPDTSRSDDRQPRVQVAMTASASRAAGDPIVARKPVPLAEAAAETRRYVDSSAGPDRAQDIVRLRAQVTQSEDLVECLAQVHSALTRLENADESPNPTGTAIGANIRQEQARLRSREEALRDAEMAQQSRQTWLDAHSDTVRHLNDLQARAQRRPGRRSVAYLV